MCGYENRMNSRGRLTTFVQSNEHQRTLVDSTKLWVVERRVVYIIYWFCVKQYQNIPVWKCVKLPGECGSPVRCWCYWCLKEKAGKLQTVSGVRQQGHINTAQLIWVLVSSFCHHLHWPASGVGCHACCHSVIVSWPCGHCLLSADTALDTR